MEALQEDKANVVLLYTTSLLEKQRAEIDGKDAIDMFKVDDEVGNVDFWIFVTPYERPPRRDPDKECGYNSGDDYEMITKCKPAITAANILDFKDEACIANLCCYTESLTLLEHLEENPLIKFATLPDDLNVPARVVYRRQK